MSSSVVAAERPPNKVFKSGSLFISSKGLGWKSWKKRWFILTRTSLVFFKNDPNELPQRSSEVNLTLGGIDLYNSGSVVIREDKKLLTVLLPDGRDGRAFTLKAEKEEDLFEWKTALEDALAQAPNAALVMGQNGIFQTDTNDTLEGSFNKWRDKRLVKSLVVGRPILLALEDIDGSPSFLEKALLFLEKYGTKVEGILRQSADVEEVERRVQEYEEGKNEFSPDEDAHVVGDCVKHVLRELPSSPVPASCCAALLEAYKIDQKEARLSAMRSAILETFPEPNRRLLQRILKMMHTISLHAHENRMNASAVAACMAPLLLRPLLAGECELEDEFDSTDDNSAQLLAAANAANNAHAIVTTLLEEHEYVFDDENLQRCSLSAVSGIRNSGSEDLTDDENLDLKDNGFHDAQNELGPEMDHDADHVSSGRLSESSGYAGNDLYEFKECGDNGDLDAGSPRNKHASSAISNILVNPQLLGKEQVEKKEGNHDSVNHMETPNVLDAGEAYHSMGEILSSVNQGRSLAASPQKSMNTSPNINSKRLALWGRSMARKTLSADSTDSSGEEELGIQRLEIAKNELQQRIAKEARGNAILQANLERRKQALHEHRLALEQDVARLQEQLQAERHLRAALEVGLSMSSGQFSSSHGIDSKTRAELEEIALAEADVARLKEKVAELHHQLNQQRQHHSLLSDACAGDEQGQTSFQKRFILQDFDATVSPYNHERKQRTVESLPGENLRNTKAQALISGSSARLPSQKHVIDSTSLSNSRSSAASSISTDEFHAVDSASVPSTSTAVEVLDCSRHPSTASSTLVELTTRLDFFKERRFQLMEQLQKLDLNFSTSSQDFA